MRSAACRVALPLFALMLVAGPPAALAKNPPGAVRLAPADYKVVGKTIRCGRLAGHWQAGSRMPNLAFLSYAREAAYVVKRAYRHSTRSATRRDLVLARALRRRAARLRPICGPLRLNLRHATGLALRPAAKARTRTVDLSNLDVVTARGKLREAVTSGSADVSRFFTAPNGKVYVLFKFPVNLNAAPAQDVPADDEPADDEPVDDEEPADDGSADDEPGDEEDPVEDDPVDDEPVARPCLLAEVAPATGEPTCVDDTLYSIRATTYPGANPPIQFDAEGAIYYTGVGYGSGTVLRRYLDGKSQDYINQNLTVYDFLVLGDGDVLVTGTTGSTQARWVRRIDKDLRVRTVRSWSANFMRLFPDGNTYLGMWGAGNFGVRRFDTATKTVDAKYWISGAGREAEFDADGLCAEADQGAKDAFCQWFGGRVIDIVTTAAGKVYAVAGAEGTGRLVQYYPQLALPETKVRKVTAEEVVGDKLALAGLDEADHMVLELHDTATDAETELLGPDAELEIYHLAYAEKTGKLLFDGLRFSDDRYVAGEVDIATGQVTVAAASTQSWIQIEPF